MIGVKIGKFKNHLLLILLTTVLSYGLTLKMYFWKDDFALMIKAMHPQDPVGFFGAGILGDGAYRYIAVPFEILYPLFKLNPMPYFFVGIILYFIASLSVYFLGLIVYKKKQLALLTAIIFASGYIGADSIYGLTNSYQTSWVITFLCWTLIFLIKHFNDKNLFYYFLSLVLFYYSLDTGYIRAHGFIVIIFASVFLLIDKFNLKKISWIFIKYIPFFLIFKKAYLANNIASNGTSKFIETFKNGDFSYFNNPLLTFFNVIFPTIVIEKVTNFLNKLLSKNLNIETVFLILGLLFFVFNMFIFLKFFRKNLYNLRIIMFALTSIIGSFIGVFYISAASTYLISTHRYLTSSLVGLSFYWTSLFIILSRFFKNKSAFIIISSFTVIFLYLVLGNLYAIENINSRTEPQKKFFSQLKRYVPTLSGKPFFFFDVSNKNNSQGKFGAIFGAGSVGGSPEISLHYDIDRYSLISSFSSFDDFISKYKKEGGTIENSFAFFYENENLINNSTEFRNILKNGKKTKLNLGESWVLTEIDKKNQPVFKNKDFVFPFPQKLSSLTNNILRFKLKIEPLILSDNTFLLMKKFNDISEQVLVESHNEQVLSNDIQNKSLYLAYLLSRSRYYNEASIQAFDFFQDQVPEKLIDQKLETTWMAGRGSWHNIIHHITDQIEYIEINLKQNKEIGGILFTNGHKLRTPTAYRILVPSNNGIGWTKVLEINHVPQKESNEKWFDKIPQTNTNKVRIEILDSQSGDAPQLAEIELVEKKYSDLDFSLADKISLNPITFIKSFEDYNLVKEYFGKNGLITFSFYSDKDNDFVNPPINIKIKGLDNAFDYEIPIPSNGQHLIKGKFYNLNLPARYTFSDFELESPPLKYYLTK